MTEQIIYPRFIDIQPCGKDQFDGKSQERTAESIAKFIQSNNDKNKLIGLDGDWGSGKSNLIKILENKFLTEYHFFIYDAWSHQEDLQRRSFLEDLTKDISACENPVVNNQIWTKRLKALLAKKKEVRSKTIPKLSTGIVAFVFIFVFTPIFTSIANQFPCLLSKVLIPLIPIFIVLTFCLIDFISNYSKRRKLLKSHHKILLPPIKPFNYKYFISNLIYIYKQKELENEIHEIISENEPSITEFRKWLTDLDEELVKTSKKIIIVYDNMDRLPTEKVLQLWSSIHTFFSSDEPLNNIWVIVPFDRKHIRLAFDKIVKIESKGNTELSEDKHIIKSDNKADHLINKTFTVVYRVPPPILTDWKDFFKVKYREAFGNFEDEELSLTENVFDFIQSEITPRSIISFINELVSLKLIWGNKIKMPFIAVFILNKELILEDPVNSILTESYLGKTAQLFKNDNTISDCVSALIYNVDIEKATQITMTNSIKNFLRNNERNKILEIYTNKHFLDILSRVLDRESIEIDNIVSTLDVIDFKYYDSNNDLKSKVKLIWESICLKYIENSITEQVFTETQKILIKHSYDKILELTKHILHGIANPKEFSGNLYYTVLLSLNEYINSLEKNINITSLIIKKEVQPAVFLDYLRVAKSNFNIYKLFCNVEELNKHLIEFVPDKLEDQYYLSFIKHDYDLSLFRETLKNAITGLEKPLTIENFYNVIQIYKDVLLIKPFPVQLKDTEILEFINELDGESPGFYDLISMRLVRGDEFKDESGYFEEFLDEPDDETIKNILELVEYYKNYSDLLLISLGWNKTLLIAVLKKLTDLLNGSSVLTLSDIINN